MSDRLCENARMNPHFAELAFILDRSGFIGPIADAAIEGFNHFLHEQQHAQGEARLTLVLFDDEYLVPIQSIPIDEAIPLDHTSYIPRGSTALLDAIGRTVDELGTRLAAQPEPQRPGKVIIAILIDGLENASQQFTWRDIAAPIRHQAKKYAWEFLFLGASQDAIATAAQPSIAAENAANFAADGTGVIVTSAAVGRKMKACRARTAGRMTAEEAADAVAPLQEIVAGEDNKRREK